MASTTKNSETETDNFAFDEDFWIPWGDSPFNDLCILVIKIDSTCL
jgi:hypothetical protein